MAVQESDPRKTNEASHGAQDEREFTEPRRGGSADEELPVGETGGNPDVLLDVPVLNVEELQLEVQDLRAHISARAEIAGFLKIDVGVDAYLDEVKLGVKGVEAQVLLKVRLERILGTIDRALDVINNNPQILGADRGRATRRGGEDRDANPGTRQTVRDSGQFVEEAEPEAKGESEAGSEELGRVVRRTVDGSGDIFEVTLDEAGEVVEESPAGNVTDLRVEEEYVDDQGHIVGRARDEAGNLVEEILDGEGNVLDLNVVEGPEDPGTGEDAGPQVNATPAAERKAWELDLDLSGIEGTGSGGRVLVRDVERATARSRVNATPSARDKAQELGVDLFRVVGSGAEGRVTLEDVANTAEGEG